MDLVVAKLLSNNNTENNFVGDVDETYTDELNQTLILFCNSQSHICEKDCC